MKTNHGLRLFTKTWPKKTSDININNELNSEHDDNDDEYNRERPLTATLERPQVLDAKYMDQIDMSLIRKEFLAVATICRVPLSNINRAATTVRKSRHRTAIIERRRPLPVTKSPGEKSKKQRKHETLSEAEASWEDESLSSGRETGKRTAATLLRPPRIVTSVTSKSKLRKPAVSATAVNAEINNNASISNSVKPISTKLLPEPCTTCGRPDAPERFHSHPTTPLKPIRKLEIKIPTKNTVQKPVAIRYKSKLEPKAPEIPVEMAPIESKVKSAKGPRTLTCYICGREFGTASLPLHEPKCLEKWERENRKLPRQLQKKRPIKPDTPMTKEEWNKFAWESAQAQLISCKNCQRTFLPDRLEVHLRSCKEPQRGPVKSSSVSAISDLSHKTTLPQPIPGLVPCPHCGKMFGSKSVKIHEPQCLKKLQKEKEMKEAATSEERPSSTDKKPHMFPCYLCGRLFGVASIYIHEPQCLKKWRAENDKLPIEKRRPTPPKPDIKFTPDGKIDFLATEEANWQSHLDQLVPCHLCKRTFNPDRVDVHERSCKGPPT